MQAYKVRTRRISRYHTHKPRMCIELNRKQHQSKTLDFPWQYPNPTSLLRTDLSQAKSIVAKYAHLPVIIKTERTARDSRISRKGRVICNATRARGVRDRKGTPGSRKEERAQISPFRFNRNGMTWLPYRIAVGYGWVRNLITTPTESSKRRRPLPVATGRLYQLFKTLHTFPTQQGRAPDNSSADFLHPLYSLLI